MLLIPAVLIVGGILALVLYLEKTLRRISHSMLFRMSFIGALPRTSSSTPAWWRARNCSPAPCSLAFGMTSSVTRSMNPTRRFGHNKSGRWGDPQDRS